MVRKPLPYSTYSHYDGDALANPTPIYIFLGPTVVLLVLYPKKDGHISVGPRSFGLISHDQSPISPTGRSIKMHIGFIRS